ncbi:MAG: hypothetical protein IT366_13950 [Candidatus Hydrogenedentes bacterium]|nr:hypothetical protein [Candidatus Hydrogenedentota bacterium]
MNWKKFEDWFVESAAFVVVRIICAAVGGGVVLLGCPRAVRFARYGEGNIGERFDEAFYGWMVFAAVVAVFFAIAGPKLLHAIFNYINEH